jgi:hypothetical protein
MDIRPLIGRDEDHSLGDARPTSKSQYPDILRDAKAVRHEVRVNGEALPLVP